MKKTLSSFALLGLVASASAQPAARPAPTAAELKRNFATIEAGTEGESDEFDQLTATTARRLAAYLKAHEVSAAGAKNLGVELSAESADAAHLKVFTYSLSSGGTRGTIHKPVLQWRNAAGQLFAYAANEEAEFTKIYLLASPGRTQYLLLGQDKGSGSCELSVAYVMELKGNYLLTNRAAFDKNARLAEAIRDSDSLILCNVDLVFDARGQVLRITPTAPRETGGDDPVPKKAVLKWQGTRFVRGR
jgi:hypothetical protein